MGCYNGTCVITNLPIIYGEETKLIPIAFHKKIERGGTGLCYATDAAYPIGLAINGTYNDYGAIENYDEKSIQVKTLVKFLDFRDLGAFMDLAHDGLKKDIGYDKEEVAVGFILAHKKAFDFLTETFYREEWAKNAETNISCMVEEEDLIKNKKSKLLGIQALKLTLTSGFHNVYMPGYGENIEEFIRNNLCKKSKSARKNRNTIIEEHANIMAFINGMSVLRKNIFPPSGAGSQSSNLKQQLALNKISQDIILKKLLDYSKDDPEYIYRVMLDDCDY